MEESKETPPRKRPKYDPRHFEEDDGDEYGLSSDDEPDEVKQVRAEDEAKLRKIEKRLRKRRQRIIDAPPVPDLYPWWQLPAVLAAIGVIGQLIGVIAVVLQSKKANVAVGVMLVLAAIAVSFVITIVQTGAMTLILSVIGTLFGIEYGEYKQALTKLAAFVVFTNGLMMGLAALSPCLGLLAGLIAFGVFKALFRLNYIESLVTTIIMDFASLGTALLIGTIVVKNIIARQP